MSLRAIGLLVCVLVLFVGHSTLLDMAYNIGLYPRVTASEVEEWFAAKEKGSSASCEPDVAGWSFVCDVVSPGIRRPSGKIEASRYKAAVTSTWQFPVANLVHFPPDQPVRTKADVYKGHPPR